MRLIEPVSGELRALGADDRGKILLAIAIPWGLLVGMRMALPVLLPYLQSDFGISLSVAGLLVTVLWLAGSVGQVPAGALADRYSERHLMTIGLVFVAVALAFFVLAPTVLSLFLAVAFWGLAHSLYPIARITALSFVFPDRLGSALGLTMATGDLGQTIIPPVISAIAVGLVWYLGVIVLIPFFLVGAIAIWLAVPKNGASSTGGSLLSRDTIEFINDELRNATMLFVGFILFLYIFLWQAFTAFYPTYLVLEKGISEPVAGLLFGAFFAVGAIIKPIGGFAHDRVGMRLSLMAVLIGPVVGFFLLTIVESILTLILVTILLSSMLGTGAITQTFLAEKFSAKMRGTGLGIVRTTSAVLGAAGPVVFGVIADYGFFDEGYIALGVLLFIVVVLTYFMPQTR